MNRAVVAAVVRGTIALGMWAITGVLTLQVVFRYGFNTSLVYGEELARYILVALVFLGGIVLTAANTLTAFTPEGGAPRRGLLTRVLVGVPEIAFYVALAVSAAALMPRGMRQPSIALGLPMAFVYAPMLLFGVFGGALAVRRLVRGTGEHGAGKRA